MTTISYRSAGHGTASSSNETRAMQRVDETLSIADSLPAELTREHRTRAGNFFITRLGRRDAEDRT